MFNDLQSRLPNIPVFGWLSNRDLKDEGTAGCSSYPDITDLYYRNKYWQIFDFLDDKLEVTFHLYGAYFDNRTLVPDGPMIRVISMVHSRFADLISIIHIKLAIIKGPSYITGTHLKISPSVTSGIMTQKFQLSLLHKILNR